MAKIILTYNPALTKEKVLEVLQKEFSSKGYEVGSSKLIGADIYVRKNDWVGATIKLKQDKDKTWLRTFGYAPSFFVRLLLYGLITYLILNPKWKALILEISEFAAKSPELNGR